MKVIYSLLLLFAHSAFAQILFIDLNHNDLEKAAAIKAAKEKGEEIIVYPEGKGRFDRDKALSLLKETTPETLFISGHDGGGSFGGDRGEKLEIEEIRRFVNENPEISDNMRVLGLLGCNTANHNQVLLWKEIFPHTGFIAGYDGSAPSQKWVQGRDYIEDIIHKKDSILEETDKSRIKDLFDSFSHMGVLEVTLYADTPQCIDDDPFADQYIYRPKRSDSDEEFIVLSEADCTGPVAEFESEWRPIWDKYYYGDQEVPEDASEGEMFDLYTYLTQNEHCLYDIDDFPAPRSALFLRFFHDIKNVAVKYYEEPLELMLADINELKKMSQEELNQAFDEFIDKFNNHYEGYKKDPQRLIDEYKPLVAARVESLPDELKKLLEGGITDEEQEQIDDFLYELESSQQYSDDFGLTESEILAQEYRETIKQHKALTNITIDQVEASFDKYDEILDQFIPNLMASKSRMKEMVEKFPSTLEELKAMDRKSWKEMVHNLNNTAFSTLLSKYTELRYGLEETVVKLDSNTIPFNWHDDKIEPEDVDNSYYTKQSIMESIRDYKMLNLPPLMLDEAYIDPY